MRAPLCYGGLLLCYLCFMFYLCYGVMVMFVRHSADSAMGKRMWPSGRERIRGLGERVLE